MGSRDSVPVSLNGAGARSSIRRSSSSRLQVSRTLSRRPQRTAANHNQYKVELHEANHPTTEHWIADLANPDSADYHSARDPAPG
ncbi:hypothetical protein [Kribbella sp. C-35]|uniref:hypothetical protein n=1 Tax=Kribbella sp. C-35 TaxID=2789276 RepID=UPI00397A52C6